MYSERIMKNLLAQLDEMVTHNCILKAITYSSRRMFANVVTSLKLGWPVNFIWLMPWITAW